METDEAEAADSMCSNRTWWTMSGRRSPENPRLGGIKTMRESVWLENHKDDLSKSGEHGLVFLAKLPSHCRQLNVRDSDCYTCLKSN